MEFSVKLELEGDCKIGIMYPQEYLAVKTYEELITSMEDKLFSLTIELVNNKIHLILVSDMSGLKKQYQNISYTSDQIKKLLIGLDLEKNFTFLHTYMKNNQMFIAKPFRSKLFIQLSSIVVNNPTNL